MIPPRPILADALTAGSGFERWVLENPWPLGLGLLGAAAIVAYVLARRGEGRRGAIGGGAMALAGIAVLVTGMAVTTTGESLAARGRELVERFFAGDSEGVGMILDDGMVLSASGRTVRTSDARRFVMDLASGVRGFKVTRHEYAAKGGAAEGDHAARTRFRVRVYSELRPYSGYPLDTTWEASWRRGSDGAWRLTAIDLLRSSDGVPDPATVEAWSRLARAGG